MTDKATIANVLDIMFYTSWIEKPLFHEEGVVLNNVTVFRDVRIGRRSYMNDGVIRSGTTIGRYCSIGRRCTIGAPRHPIDWLSSHPFTFAPGFRPDGVKFDSSPTFIGNDVWIGDNVIITEGITIGDGAVLGAGCIVTKDVMPYTIVGGVPAKTIRFRFDEETIRRLQALRWWDHEEESLKGLPFNDIVRCIEALEAMPMPKQELLYTKLG